MFVTVLLFLCALGLSGIAAYYSIIGMAAIFASAFWPVVAMTGVLEVSKLVVSSWLYQKWSIIPFLLKTYLTIAVIILMGITSLGIFGFLSRAHIDQNLNNIEINLQLGQIDSKIASTQTIIDRYDGQLKLLDRAMTIQLDAQRATQALANRKQQEKERDEIRKKLDAEFKIIQDLQSNKVELKQKLSIVESKVGPIKYVAEFFADGNEVDLDKAVRWMIVTIVLVFDPLAVLMIIAANIGFKNWAESRKKKTLNPEPSTESFNEPVEIADILPVIAEPTPISISKEEIPINRPNPNMDSFTNIKFEPNIIEKPNPINESKIILEEPVLTELETDRYASNIEKVNTDQTVQESNMKESIVIDADSVLDQIKQHRENKNPQPEIPNREYRGYKY